MAGIAVLIGASVAMGPFSPKILLAFITSFLVCGGGNAINDYFDIEIDRINRPTRPLPSGRISARAAYYYSLLLFIIGIIVSALINVYAFFLALFNSFLLYTYAWRIKRRGGIGKNVVVSFLVASPFIFGGLAVIGNLLSTLLLSLLAFLVNMGREIVKDLEDFHGDRRYIRTLPSKIGFNASSKLAGAFIVLAVLISPLPYMMGFLNIGYLIMVGATDIFFIYTVAELLIKLNPTATQKNIKIGMVIALASFLIGSI
jgi:geranylgeranylglycerol-phosphate geranylgeranyltransferase